MHDPNSLLIQSLAHKILGRLKNREEDKPDDELDQRDSTHGDNEVSPSHIIRSMANCVLLTREVGQNWPSDERRHDLCHRPIHRQDRQEELVGSREELEEDGGIDGEVSPNSKTPQGSPDANGSEVGRASCNHAEDGRHAQGGVKCPATTEDVASETPEHGPG